MWQAVAAAERAANTNAVALSAPTSVAHTQRALQHVRISLGLEAPSPASATYAVCSAAACDNNSRAVLWPCCVVLVVL